jgi:hypothetical protein
LIAAALVLGGVIVLAAGYAVAGQVGLFAVAVAAGVAALLVARLRIAGPPDQPTSAGPLDARPGKWRVWLWNRRAARALASQFRAYQRIESALSWSQTSRRHYDHATRPLLQRLLAAILADRRRIDVSTDTAAARELIGEDLWPLLDPSRPASADSREPGVDIATVARVADRLERL